jgi:hypothetical protein
MRLPYQERVVTERDELYDKVGKLAIFLNSIASRELPEPERLRMNLQLHLMKAYLGVLEMRMEAWSE